MVRSKAKIGDRSVSGTVVRLLPQWGKNRGQRVEVQCPCGVLFSELYSRFSLGRRKSCKHLRDENYARIRQGRLARLGPTECLRLFELAASYEIDEAAKLAGYSKHLVKSAWVVHCKELDNLPVELREAIASSAMRAPEAAEKRFQGFSRNEIKRILRTWTMAHEEKQQPGQAQLGPDIELFRAKLAEAVELGLALAPDSEEANEVFDLMFRSVEQALGRLQLCSWARRTYPQEFSRAELGHRSRSRYRWLYEILHPLPEQELVLCLGAEASRFLQVCKHTLVARQHRDNQFRKRQKETSKILDTSHADDCPPSAGASRSGDQIRIPKRAWPNFGRPAYEDDVIRLTLHYAVGSQDR